MQATRTNSRRARGPQPASIRTRASHLRAAPVRPLARKQPKQSVLALTRETVVKLSINGVLIGMSAIALARLVPTHMTQQAQLREVQAELSFTKGRVDQLRSEFNRSFDPMQAQAVMQQESYRIDPNQRPVVFITPTTTLEDTQP